MATVLSNNPPSDVEILRDRLTEENRDLIERVEELTGGADRCAVTDDETAGKAALLVKLINETTKTATDRQKEAKRPHAELADAAFGYFKPILGDLAGAKTATLTKLDRFRQEQERKAAEERRRLEEEARKRQEEADRIAAKAKTDTDLDLAVEVEQQARAAAEAAAVVAPKEIRSSYGHLASARKTWDYRIIDPSQVPSAYMMVNEAAIKVAIKGGARKIPGVEIFEKTQTVVR
jgi:septal ring factor EnvC (AmiA/AmiB activator)